jgi:mRNA interferase RelE/StbE
MHQNDKKTNYVIELSSSARRALKKIDPQDSKKIFEKLKALSFLSENLDIKKLEKYKNLYRLRSGNYRIIYEKIEQKIIIYVVHIAPRKTVYQELENLLR